MAILSIQSHVAYGYVGNRAATFPLQRLGREVWAINTVEFSNHTGYGSWRGKVLGAEIVRELVLGIRERGELKRCDAILSGYLGDASVGEAILDTLDQIRQENPDVLYCCDPVMGDYGRGFFVREGIPEILRERIVPRAHIVTPNQFELEALTGANIHTIDDAKKAIEAIHAMGPRVVLVTSYKAADSRADHIEMLVSDETGIYRISTPELPMDPPLNGSGDLTAAIFLSRWLEKKDIREALELTTASIFAVFERTFRDSGRELKLIEAQDEIVTPTRRFAAIQCGSWKERVGA